MKVGTSSEAKTPPWVQLSSRRWRFVTRQIEGPYPDWRVAVPHVKPTLRIEIDASHLDSTIHALERLPCHDERFHTLGLEWKAQRLSLLGKPRPEDSWTRVPVKTTHAAGPDLTLVVDREYVLKALSFGLTTLECADALSPLRFNHGGRQMIIMPLRGDPIPSTDDRRSESTPTPSASILPRPAEHTPP
jgi:hypothetical protein